MKNLSTTEAPGTARAVPLPPRLEALPPIGELYEAALPVTDLARSLAFWRDLMGFRLLGSAPPPGAGATTVRLTTGGAVLALTTGGSRLPGARTRLCFMTADIERARRRLLGAGVRVGDVHLARPGMATIEVADPDGNLFDIEARVLAP